MPPVRTPKSSSAKKGGTLAAYGFLPVPKSQVSRSEPTSSPQTASKPEPTPTPRPVAQSKAPQPAATAPTPSPSAQKPVSKPPAVITVEESPSSSQGEQRRANAPTAQPAPAPAVPKNKPGRPRAAAVVRGVKEARFEGNLEWGRDHAKFLGTTTRTVFFKWFMLQPEHIDTLIDTPSLCANLKRFEYMWIDGDKHARAITNADIERLAQACPNLDTFLLGGVDDAKVDGEALIALFRHCPNLKTVRLLTRVDTQPFEILSTRPAWVPKLKTLSITSTGGRNCTEEKARLKTVREATRVRDKMTVWFIKTMVTKDELEIKPGAMFERGMNKQWSWGKAAKANDLHVAHDDYGRW
ncbi:hypothetical protein CTRI78_v009837 [Colletotrichum trifolii]|uniref:Uncharacterized protein n=1 Tax=Colletotrichum trifolii TaxID=5466 RepID=A0A4R8QPR2_COLTR|nr:hypothetical protein CTRI78_v009837 [Colletotrichum trifolii]